MPSLAFVQGNHHRGKQSQETKPQLSLDISSKGQLQMCQQQLCI